jgi:hypothetical protein
MPQKSPQQQIGPFLQYLAEQLYPSVTSLAKGEPARAIPNLPAQPGKVEGTDDPRLGAGLIEALDLASNLAPVKAGAAVGAVAARKALARPEAARAVFAPLKGKDAAAAFHSAIAEAKNANPNGAAVALYSPEEYAGMKLYTTPDKSAGFAIKPDGDIVSVFKHPESQHKGVMDSLMPAAIKAGGKKLDAFDPWLPQQYGRHGFVERARVPFNREYAPEGWNYATSGEPDVVFMTLGKKGEQFKHGAGPRVAEYDDAVRLQTEAMPKPRPQLSIVPSTPREPGAPLVGAEDFPGLVSTRFPTAKKAPEKPLETYLQPNIEALRADPQLHEGMMRLLATYPGMPKNLASASPMEIEDTVRGFMKDNLRAIYDAQPDAVRKSSRKWYEGANKLARERGEQYGLPTESTSAVYASLSPQKDWFMNVGLGDRTLDIVMNQQNKMLDQRMLDTAERIYKGAVPKEVFERMKGKPFGEMSPTDQAVFTRLYDETYNSRNYKVVTPEGDFGDFARTKAGDPKNIAWGTFGQIENAINAIRAKGDVDTISSGVLGNRHKVRSFYNNILHPDAPQGDVTADTHHMAASLFRPLSGSSTEVIHGLGSSGPAGTINAPKSAVSGIQGTYPLFAEAARDVAKDVGEVPRAIQSITWEGIRGLFTPEFKRSADADKITEIWKQLGIKNAAEARDQVVNAAGGYRLPEWWTGAP